MQNELCLTAARYVGRLLVAAGLVAVGSAPALAQPWPAKPVTIVVAYPAGGDTDAVARLLGDKLAARLGKPVVVENKPGASGIIGTSQVTKAAADGYTLLMAPSTVTMAQLVLETGPGVAYDVRALTPIFQVGAQPLFLAAGPGGKFADTGSAVRASHASALTYASPGNGSPMHVLGEMFNRATGAQFVHVPYKGVAPALNDVVAGHVPLTWITYGPVEPYLKDGKITLLAVAQSERSSLAPNTPTLAELGVKGVEVTAWNGLFGPKDMPADIVRKLNKELNEIIQAPDVAQRLRVLGMHPVGGAPEVLGKVAIDDLERFTRVVKELGIKAE